MSSYSEVAQSLTESLKLTQPPVAVCLTDAVPAGVETWSGHSPAGCRFWQEARSRVFATPAAAADLGDALKIFAELSYVRSEDLAAIPALDVKPKHVIYGPLASIPL